MGVDDPHVQVAAALFKVKPEDVTVEMRQAAKEHTYAMRMGRGASTIMEEFVKGRQP